MEVSAMAEWAEEEDWEEEWEEEEAEEEEEW